MLQMLCWMRRGKYKCKIKLCKANNVNVPFVQCHTGGASRRSPFAFPKSSSNRALKSSNAESNLSPYTCPLSILNASHSRMNCSRSFNRAMDSSGSLEPRARARYEATMVDSPPKTVVAIAVYISAYMRSKSVQRPF